MVAWQCPQDWTEWTEWLAAGLHGRSQWRLPLVMLGMLFAKGRRTVTTWLRAVGVSDDYVNYYYFLSSLGRKTNWMATQLVWLILEVIPTPDCWRCVVDDSPTRRYGPKVQGAGIHHNPTPGPADQKFVYGHIWVTLSLVLRHPWWHSIGLPLVAMLYVRQKDIVKIPRRHRWKFATKLELGARLVEWLAKILKDFGKSIQMVVDGGYVKRPFLSRAKGVGAIVIGRLRRDAALRCVPKILPPGQRGRGRPPKYGKGRISLAKRAGQKKGWETVQCVLYGGQLVSKTIKTFLATYVPAGGMIRVVLVRELDGWFALLSTDPDVSAREILEAFSDRAAIEQNFHDLKEVWGAGQQQVRNIWTNIGCYHLNVWMHTLAEMWAWNRPHQQLCDRSLSPWDDADRRPSHADRRKALRLAILRNEFLRATAPGYVTRKIKTLFDQLLQLAA